MITSAILGVFLQIINIVINLFPAAASLPAGINDFFSTLQTLLYSANAIFPIDTLLQAVFFVLSVEVIIISIRGILKIYHMVRG